MGSWGSGFGFPLYFHSRMSTKWPAMAAAAAIEGHFTDIRKWQFTQ